MMRGTMQPEVRSMRAAAWRSPSQRSGGAAHSWWERAVVVPLAALGVALSLAGAIGGRTETEGAAAALAPSIANPTVAATAAPDAGSVFAGGSGGACSGLEVATCRTSVAGYENITARIALR